MSLRLRVRDDREAPVDHEPAVETEQIIQRGRLAVLVLALGLAISFGSDRSLGVTVAVVLLSLGTLGTHLALRRPRGSRTITTVGWATFATDTVVCALVLLAVADDPVDPVVFLTMILAIEAAVRWGTAGAVGGGLLAGALGVAWAHTTYAAVGRDLPGASVAFRALIPVLLALPVGLLIERLRRQRGYTQHLFEHTSDPTVVVAEGRVVAVNPAAAELIGEPVERLRGAPFDTGFGVLFEVPDLDALRRLPALGRHDVPVMDRHGQQRWFSIRADASDELTFVTARDVTEERMREQQLSFRAWHDPLTGLRNRAALRSGLRDRLREEAPVGVIFLDLDGFKAINDRHGHQVGDEVLVVVADRVRQVTRDADVVHRWGGDEFCLVLPDADRDVLDAVAQRIDEALRRPVQIAGQLLDVGASWGTTLARPDDTEASILSRADERMYRRKRARAGSHRPSAR